MTQIPKNNSEALQMLKYEVGEFYKSHHDFLKNSEEKQPGVRILTMYLYLNDVEKGGGTKFNQLNITVMPKRGRAVLWPSVRNNYPHKKDGRTVHEALPVEAGVKYGVNAWFHQYDFRTPYIKGCSG
jgi:prolyl 4-hydroxylase